MTKTRAVLGAAVVALCVGCVQEAKIVEIEPTKADFRKLDDSVQLRARALTAKGDTIADIKDFTWSSESTAVADVSASGVVTPRGNGDTAVIAKAPNGASGEVFVSVCLPKELSCEPKDKIDLRVGSGAPVKCQVYDCRDDPMPQAQLTYDVLAQNVVSCEKGAQPGQKGITAIPLTGQMVGDTVLTVTAFGYEKKIQVHVDEALPIPGEVEYKKALGAGKKKDEPYSGAKGGGGLNHIINNMKF